MRAKLNCAAVVFRALFGVMSLALLVASVLLHVAPIAAQVISKNPMPTPRMGAGAAVVDGRIFVIGGTNLASFLGTVEEYDSAKDTWATRASMPTARAMLAIVAVGGKIYALGGRSDKVLSVVEAYDVRTDRWTAVAPLPQPRWGLMAAEAAGKIFAIGGITGTGAARQSVSSVDVFDNATNAWTPGKQVPTSLQSAAIATHGGQIILAGGRAGAGNTGRATSVVHLYRPDASAWTVAPSLIEARTGAAAVVVGSKLVVVGGASAGTPSPHIEILELGSQRWTRADIPLSPPRTGIVAASVGSKLYVIGGATEESLSGITGLVQEISVN